MGKPPAIAESEWTIGRLLAWTTDYLTRHAVDDPRLSAEVLLAHAAGCRRIELYTRFEVPLADEPRGRFRDWVKRAAAHEPIAYLVGEKEFFSLPMFVSPDVLIPRAETEQLVECVIDHCRNRKRDAGLRLLDPGTGSGCIAVAALHQVKEARAVATDISGAALAVARRNAERHGVADRLALVECDGLRLPADAIPADGFDVLMCNPPYIPAGAIDSLDRNVRDYEPRIALTDGGDGLSFYRALAAEGLRLLKSDGAVIVEVADGQAAPVTEIFADGKGWTHRGTWRDRVGGHERVLMFVGE